MTSIYLVGVLYFLCFPVRSLIPFQLIFVKDVKSVSRFFFFFLHVDIQLCQHHLLKRRPLFHCTVFASLTKTRRLYLWRSKSGRSILFPGLVATPPPQPFCPNYCSFIVSLKAASYQSFNFVLL